MSNELFILASRKKYRFPTLKGGEMVAEQLWELELISDKDNVTTLDVVAKTLNGQLKSLSEESFVTEKTTIAKDTENKLELVKFVIATKKHEKELALAIKERRAAKERVLEVLKKKKNEALKGLTVEELEAKLAELESIASL